MENERQAKITYESYEISDSLEAGLKVLFCWVRAVSQFLLTADP
jgi:hypothetical protein